MIFGIPAFTVIHVVLSLVGMVAGLVVVGALIGGTRLDRWSSVFLVTTIGANATGFGFPGAFQVSLVIGSVSLVVLAGVLYAQYGKHIAGSWRTAYAVGVVLAIYLNVFILVVQLFRRLPGLIAAAPTQSEAPFAITQLLVLGLFAWLGVAAVKGRRAAPAGMA
jgi:hypothetical protein